jgi:type IV secretory system conjugative DNA transfer VirD4/TraG family protein
MKNQQEVGNASGDVKNYHYTSWDLNENFLNFEGNPWTIRDACEGIMCFGSTGSGKSSGPLRTMALTLLMQDTGGIVFCSKPSEKAIWQAYAEETGRTDDLMYLTEESFNFLDYEHSRPGEGAGEVENIVHLFMEVAEVGKDKKNKGTNETYWKDAVKQLLRNTISLLILAEEPLNLQNIKQIIDTVPRSVKEANTTGDYCCALIERIKQSGNSRDDDFILLSEYFRGEFAKLDNRTRSNVISSYTTMADAMLRGEMKRCFCSEETTFTPEMIFDGKILIVDYSIKKWQKLGSYASAVIKYCFMKAVERRSDEGCKTRPVFIFADEYQQFALPYDQVFQTTARSSRVISVYGTQNIGNLQAVYGHDEVNSLLGNLGTKILCQNGDDKSNKWASESIGKVVVKRRTMNKGEGHNLSGKNSENSNSESMSEGWSEQKDFLVDPMSFTSLSKGSDHNQCNVEFILWQSGRVFANGQPFVKTSVKQDCQLTCGAKKKYKCKSKSANLFAGNIMERFGACEIFEFILCIVSVAFFLRGYYWIVNGTDKLLISLPYQDAFVSWGGAFLLAAPAGIFIFVDLCANFLSARAIKSKNDKPLKINKTNRADFNSMILYALGASMAAYYIYKRIISGESFLNVILIVFVVVVFVKFASSSSSQPNEKMA